MTLIEFEYIQNLALEEAGIKIEKDKHFIVESRLNQFIKKTEFNSVSKLISHLKTSSYGKLHQIVVESLTVRETYFFRDPHVFTAIFDGVLPKLMKERRNERRIRIWSAACANGQEPYSLAMRLHEMKEKLEGWNVLIFATDYSKDALDYARKGVYSVLEVNRGLPSDYLTKYFTRIPVGFAIQDRIKNMVDFNVINLTKPFPILPPMDIVLLRNVLIYIAESKRADILRAIDGQLSKNGVVIPGTAETMLFTNESWKRFEFNNSVFFMNTSR
jgi:chemotaxis protein methyltransferase CheR